MFDFPDLDARTRELMLEEIAHDRTRGTLYLSPRLSSAGKANYVQYLQHATRVGNEETLAAALRQPGHFQALEPRGTGWAKVPYNAAEVLAEGEFNRFYIRALCRRAIEDGAEELIIFRSKPVRDPRPESEAKIGRAVDPHRLLADLRMHPGTDTVLGLPQGPNSGLSVRLPEPRPTDDRAVDFGE